MANTKSAIKYIRKTETRALRNRQIKTRLKTFAKKVTAAAAADDQGALATTVCDYISTLDKAGKNGLVHPNKIARHKARCAQLLAAKAAPAVSATTATTATTATAAADTDTSDTDASDTAATA
jgi:small subunit ribosomal protein S20